MKVDITLKGDKIPLYLDMDDVILPTTEVKKLLVKEYQGTGMSLEEADSQAMVHILQNYDVVPVKDTYLSILDKIKEKYDIVYLSMYITPEEYAYKSYIARSHGVPFIGLSIAQHNDKSSIDLQGGILVDDQTYNLASATNAGRLIQYGTLSSRIREFNYRSTNGIEFVSSMKALASKLGV